MDGDATRHAGAIEITAGSIGIFRISVGVDDAAFFADSLCPPDGRVSDGGAELENCSGLDGQGKLLKHARHRGTDDGNVVLGSIAFHLCQNFVALGEHRVQVIVDWAGSDEVMVPPARFAFLLQLFLGHWFSSIFFAD